MAYGGQFQIPALNQCNPDEISVLGSGFGFGFWDFPGKLWRTAAFIPMTRPGASRACQGI
jgi:hypothetical protein